MDKESMTKSEKIAYNCRKATLLIEKQHDAKLNTKEAMELRFHLLGCEVCRIYQQQSSLMNNMLSKIFKGKTAEEFKLDEDYKAQLKKQVKDRLRNFHP